MMEGRWYDEGGLGCWESSTEAAELPGQTAQLLVDRVMLAIRVQHAEIQHMVRLCQLKRTPLRNA